MAVKLMSQFSPTPPKPNMGFNTGTLFDLLTGRAVLGIDGKIYIDGGLGPWITGYHGSGNQYKSTFMFSLAMRVAALYDIEGTIEDDEAAATKDTARLVRCAGEYADKIGNFDERFKLMDSAATASTFLKDLTDYCKLITANAKDRMITLPIIDPITGKAARAHMPTLVILDSLSNLKTQAALALLAGGLDDEKIRTIYMADANQETILMNALRDMAESYGLIICVTAHWGKELNLETRGPAMKQLQHMKQGNRVKNVGSKFEFLTNNLIQCMGATVLLDDSKEPLYKCGDTPKMDVNEITALVQRCKTNSSGNSLPFVVSQSDGLLSDVTNYHFLRAHDYFGLNGNNQRHQPFLLPDVTISRNTFREAAEKSYEMRRAMELAAQWLFIKTYWNIQNMPLDMSMDPKTLMDKLLKSGSIKVNDILNSRGTWSYKKEAREYMSIFDVIAAVSKE